MAKRKRLSSAAIITPELTDDRLLAATGDRAGPRSRAPIADVAGDAAAHSAFEEVAEELRNARAEGRMIVKIPLEAVEVGHLVRDRVAVDLDEMAVLKDSLRARGQQTPIEVVDLGGDRYGLISGWRRVEALRDLAMQAGNAEVFGTVQALVRRPEGAPAAYQAMVEENEIRADLSFYERARIAVQAARQGVYLDTKVAVQSLFSAARAPKRSKIISFTLLVDALDDCLLFPTAIPEKLGLALVAALQKDAGFKRGLTSTLRRTTRPDAATERRVLEQALRGAKPKNPLNETADEVIPGVMMRHKDHHITLTGKAVDGDLLEDLRLWLVAREDR